MSTSQGSVLWILLILSYSSCSHLFSFIYLSANDSQMHTLSSKSFILYILSLGKSLNIFFKIQPAHPQDHKVRVTTACIPAYNAWHRVDDQQILNERKDLLLSSN